MFSRTVVLWFESRKYLLQLFKIRSKVHQKNMSQESALNFNQWETLSENYKAIGVFVYKIADINFVEFIQT